MSSDSLLKTNQDPHWRGYSQQCAPCLANFTYIVHLEQAGEEGWLLGRTGLKSLVGNVSRVMNPTSGGSSQSESTVEAFVRQLSCATVQRLYHRCFFPLSKTLAHIYLMGMMLQSLHTYIPLINFQGIKASMYKS